MRCDDTTRLLFYFQYSYNILGIFACLPNPKVLNTENPSVKPCSAYPPTLTVLIPPKGYKCIMGNVLFGLSSVWNAEKDSWVKSHCLVVTDEYYNRYWPIVRDSIPEGTTLYMKKTMCYLHGLAYDHYYVTDNVTTIEFGCGDIRNNVVVAHKNPKNPGDIQVEKHFLATAEVKERMRRVLGATGYSLALRNCEHVARFIQSGAWFCTQMYKNGTLYKQFFDYMFDNTQKLVHSMQKPTRRLDASPGEFMYLDDPHQERVLHEGLPPSLRFMGRLMEGIGENDKNNFNIAFIGPTGCGKSLLINRFFNRTVAESRAGAQSVTREINAYKGSRQLYDHTGKWRDRHVNIIDTIGFCDSQIKPEDVEYLIKFFLK